MSRYNEQLRKTVEWLISWLGSSPAVGLGTKRAQDLLDMLPTEQQLVEFDLEQERREEEIAKRLFNREYRLDRLSNDLTKLEARLAGLSQQVRFWGGEPASLQFNISKIVDYIMNSYSSEQIKSILRELLRRTL